MYPADEEEEVSSLLLHWCTIVPSGGRLHWDVLICSSTVKLYHVGGGGGEGDISSLLKLSLNVPSVGKGEGSDLLALSSSVLSSH